MSAVAGGGAASPPITAFLGLRKLIGVFFVSLLLGLFAAHFFLGKAAVVRNMVTAFEAGGAQVGWFWAPSLLWDVEFGTKDARATV